MQDQIIKEMTIEEIFSNFPTKSQKIAQEMTSAGLHCVGCSASTWETLEAGMYSHGYSQEDVEELVGRLNEILKEEADPSTITLTQRAAAKFKKILKEEGKEDWNLRFGDRPGGCSGYEYVLDFSKAPEEGDTVFSSHGVDIHVHESMIDRLLGCEIDFHEGLNGSGFKISNPNAKGSCGCGSSQSY